MLRLIAEPSELLPAESSCHWRMNRPGPAWVEGVLLDPHVVDRPDFDARSATLATYDGGIRTDEERETAVTGFPLALATSLALLGSRPSPWGLPGLSSFRRPESRPILAGARRRLDLR